MACYFPRFIDRKRIGETFGGHLPKWMSLIEKRKDCPAFRKIPGLRGLDSMQHFLPSPARREYVHHCLLLHLHQQSRCVSSILLMNGPEPKTDCHVVWVDAERQPPWSASAEVEVRRSENLGIGSVGAKKHDAGT